MSPCARYLITIGEMESNDEFYSVDFWLWTMGDEQPNGRYATVQVKNVNYVDIKIAKSQTA